MSTINTPQVITAASAPAIQPKPVTTVDDIVIPEPEEKKDKSNLLAGTLTGLALLGLGSYLIYNVKKGKGIPEKTIEMFKKEGNVFERGIAKTKNGALFNGKIVQKTEKGDKIERYYINGKLQRSTKNVDDKGFYDPTKESNYDKFYSYSPEGKLTGISKTVGNNGKAITTEFVRPVIQKADDFAAQGGKIVDGKAIKADNTPYSGFIVEKNGSDTLIKEYKDGKQVSERLNTTLKDRVTKADGEHYVRNEAELDEIAKKIEAEKQKAVEKPQAEPEKTKKNAAKNKARRKRAKARKKAQAEAARKAEIKAREEAEQKARTEAEKNKKPLKRISNFIKNIFKTPDNSIEYIECI